MSANRGHDVLDPRLMPEGAEQPATPTYPRSQYPAPAPIRAGHAGYSPHQAYYGAPRTSTGGDMSSAHEARLNEDDYSPEENNQDANGDDGKRPRACEACRGLKVRCDQDPAQPDRPCRRCAKAGRQCIITQPSRKRQKKADSRVADLERKLDALTAALHAQNNGTPIRMETAPNREPQMHMPRRSLTGIDERGHLYESRSPSNSIYPAPQSSSAPSSAYPNHVDAPLAKKRKHDDGSNDLHSKYYPSKQPAGMCQQDKWDTLDHEELDRLQRLGLRRELYHMAPEALISRINELVDPALHDRIFARFVHELAPLFPAVVFPPETKARDVLESKPILFMCILAAGSNGILSPEQQGVVFAEVDSTIADCAMKYCVKSLELIQSILVVVLYYKPPEKRHQANFYMVIHMAATMALDLGLGRRFSREKTRRGFGGPAAHLPPGRMTAMEDSDTPDARRTWLGCYYLAASCAQSFRRPVLIRWTNYMQECCDFLLTSPEAAPSDRIFAQHLLIQKICEEISEAFHLDDASANISISDPKVSYTLDIYEQKLKDWKDKLPEDLKQQSTLLFFYEATSLYLHEIALHVNHNIDDFRLPFTEEGLKGGAQSSEVLTQRQMSALESCLGSAHRLLDHYTSFSLETIAKLPTLFFFSRCVYAIVVLIKMHMAAISPGSEVGKIIKPEDIKVEQYLDSIWYTFLDLKKRVSFAPPAKVIQILGILRDWFLHNQSGEHKANPERPRPVPHGRRLPGDSRLQVLSEAAAAGSQSSMGQQNWTYDSPQALHHNKNKASSSASSGGPSPITHGSATNTPHMSSMHAPTPKYQGYDNPGHDAGKNTSGADQFNYLFDGSAGFENLEWAQGMNLEQVLDGAFRDLDMSGDLSGWFMGDGVNFYETPDQGTNVGAAHPEGNNAGGSRW